MRFEAGHHEPMFQLRLTRASVVVQAIGKIDRLLDFKQNQAGGCRTESPCFVVKDVDDVHWPPVHQVDDRPSPMGRFDLRSGRLALQTERQSSQPVRTDRTVRWVSQGRLWLILRTRGEHQAQI